MAGVNAFEYVHVGKIPEIAYSIKRRIDYSGFGLENSKDLEEVYKEAGLSDALRKKINWAIANSFDNLIDVTRVLFVEEESGVVCEKCAWEEYDFQIALGLCRKSARKREKEMEKQNV